MPTRHIANFKQGRGGQRGGVLMVMLVILVVSVAAILVNSLTATALKNSRKAQTAAALAQAKEALIGYAVTYADTHTSSPQVNGYLPCPDPNGIAGVNGEGSSETCGNQNVSAIGRLPWKTLGLPTLRDGNGECLWYAVAGSYKNNPMTYNMMDWDNYGLFQILAANGVVLAGQPPGQSPDDSQVVAAIFSPGVALSSQGQNRAPDGNAPICGGNYNPGNYLDKDTAISANNATPSTAVNAISQFFTAGATANINDQVIFITRSDIWNAIKKRNDFGAFVNSMLSSVTTCLQNNSMPNPIRLNYSNSPPTESTITSATGSLYIGRVPKSCLTAPLNSSTSALNNWQDNLLYAICTSGKCINSNSCDGVVIFSGERNTSQTRITNTDKNTWSNYLENTPSANLTAFTTGGTSFSGASSYSATSPSTDVVACIP